MGYGTLLIAVFGISIVQLIVKYRFNTAHGVVPTDGSIGMYLLKLLEDPWLWFAAVTLVTAALLWYFALSRLPLSATIAFAALVYPLVMIGSAVFLREAVSLPQIAGCVLIVSGVWLVAATT